MASGQTRPVGVPSAATAIVNVNVISMDSERVDAGQTVLVRGDRILAVGAAGELAVPRGAAVIDGAGRYLVPGLTDAHVHLEGDGTGFGTARPDFGDGPLYLAYGVTTVFNLRGTPVQLDWRRRVEQGELVGPTIYTAGEFVNEPRVNTAEDVEREITAQAREGYDLIKFHEIMDPAQGFTTTGLALPAYLEMIEAAEADRIPLVGHAPVNLGLEVLLQARQPLAHIGTLSNIYFLPLNANRAWLFLTAAALVTLIAVVTAGGVAAFLRRWQSTPPRASARLSRLRVLAGIVTAAWVPAVVSAPVMRYLQPDVRARWLRGPQAGPPGYRYTDFTKKVAGALHRAGVPLMAGTDAMGFPRIAPGASLHHELRLLIESGLRPYEAMRAATVVPATFLAQDREFGTVAAGKRADVLLVDGNPLQDIGYLARPVGVMARGRWFPRERLRQMLATLASDG